MDASTGMARGTGKRANRFWWKDIDLVREELNAFCETHSLDKHTLPSTEQLRTNSGGNPLAHAVKMYGGVGNLSQALGMPTFSAAAARRREAVNAQTPRQTLLPHADNKTIPHGYFADSKRFRDELIAFGHNQTNNPYWKVLPSAAQMRHGGRMDLARAIDRYGGSEAVAARFGMLSAAEYSYHNEFYNFLRELRLYQVATGQEGKMPALTRMAQDGRADLVRLIRKHGGQQVLAARLYLKLEKERKPYLLWGPFDLDFAIDMLNVSQIVALEIGRCVSAAA